MSTSAFARCWQTDLTRDAFLDYLTTNELCTMRRVSRDFADTIAVKLFRALQVRFDVNSFTRGTRLLALDRIARHVKHVHFSMPHGEQTFLPPLLDPETLEELSFQYGPGSYTSRPSSSSSDCSFSSSSSASKYGSWEMNDLLVRQYPPLFHAATNIVSFVRVFNALSSLRSLRISCPGQPANQRHRRSVVDYALVSLRIAIETVNSKHLESLTLDPIHPSAAFYLRPQTGLGTSPASTRVWHRITKLSISMDSPCDLTEDEAVDHLKILHTYLQNFRNLEELDFTWLGNNKGPCPLSLNTEPSTSRPTTSDRAMSCMTTSGLPLGRPVKLRHLRSMRLGNAVFDASQASAFITTHRKTLHDFEFERCELRSGTWEQAFEPLSRMSNKQDWKAPLSNVSSCSSLSSEVMEVPIMYSPVEECENPLEAVCGPLWAPDDKDMKMMLGRLNVFMQCLPKVSRREMVANGLRRLLRSVRIGWH